MIWPVYKIYEFYRIPLKIFGYVCQHPEDAVTIIARYFVVSIFISPWVEITLFHLFQKIRIERRRFNNRQLKQFSSDSICSAFANGPFVQIIQFFFSFSFCRVLLDPNMCLFVFFDSICFSISSSHFDSMQ